MNDWLEAKLRYYLVQKHFNVQAYNIGDESYSAHSKRRKIPVEQEPNQLHPPWSNNTMDNMWNVISDTKKNWTKRCTSETKRTKTFNEVYVRGIQDSSWSSHVRRESTRIQRC